jgi:hypothetical protein
MSASEPVLRELSPLALLSLHAAAARELRRRQVITSSNNPVGDYADYLVAEAFDLELTPKSTTGHGATARDGLRYEVKARRITGAVGSRQLSAIRKLDKQHFDVLVGVLFDEDCGVHRACVIPHGTVLECASFQKHTNAWILHLRDEVWSLPGVVDATEQVARYQR